jgi:hypothetical protein
MGDEHSVDTEPEPERGRTPSLGRMLTTILVAVLTVLTFLLGRSMVQHRFFQGGRVHLNGSVGQ